MSNSAIAPVIAGLAVGVIFIVAIALTENSLSSTSFYTQPPNMFLIVDDGKQYNGEKGSFCHANGCADAGFSMPQDLVVIEKGSEVSVRAAGYLQPSQLYWVLANGFENGNFTQEQEMIAQKLNSTKFVIDLDGGDYILNVQAIWAGYYTEVGNASYNYHIRVVG